MLVSVIIPTFNRVELLSRSIKSVLNQSYDNYEIVIVDDYSTDNTKEMIETLNHKKITYIKNDSNLYAAESRNIGIQNSKGELISFLDDDDEWFPCKLEKQVKLFKKNKHIGLVYSSIMLYFNDYKLSYCSKPIKKGYIYKDMLIKNYIGATPSVMIRKIALDELNTQFIFDKKFPAREEYDLFIRISKKWKIYYVSCPLVKQNYRTNIKRISTDLNNYIKAIEILNTKYKKEIEKKLDGKEKLNRLSFQNFFLGSQAIKLGNNKLAKKYYLISYKLNKNKIALLSYLFSMFGAKFVIYARIYFDKIMRRNNE